MLAALVVLSALAIAAENEIEVTLSRTDNYKTARWNLQPGSKKPLKFTANAANKDFKAGSAKVAPKDTWDELKNDEDQAIFERMASPTDEGKVSSWTFSGEFKVPPGGAGPPPTWTVVTYLGKVKVELEVVTRSVWVVDAGGKKPVVKVKGRVVEPQGVEVPLTYTIMQAAGATETPKLTPASGDKKLTNQEQTIAFEITNSSFPGGNILSVAGTATFEALDKSDTADMMNAIDIDGPNELAVNDKGIYEIVFSHKKAPDDAANITWGLDSKAPPGDPSGFVKEDAGVKTTVTTNKDWVGASNLQPNPNTAHWPKRESIGVKEKKEQKQ